MAFLVILGALVVAALLAAGQQMVPAKVGGALSVAGALFALIAVILWATHPGKPLDHLSAAWPCEIVCFVLCLVGAIFFMRIGAYAPVG